MPSVLDRLIDPDSAGTVAQPGYTISKMMDAVQRDLDDLLNTHQGHAESDVGAGAEELSRSILTYGLPDLMSLNALSPKQREDIGRVIERTIEHHEPRLRQVRAELIDPGESKDRTVRFHLEAKLNVDPSPEVAFTTILELSTGQFSVRTDSL